MKQLCLTLPMLGNEEEFRDPRQSHRVVHRALVLSIRRVKRFVPKIQKPRLQGLIPTSPVLLMV